jgi:hypothetical protein
MRKKVIIVTISKIGQNMPMLGMCGMGPPSPSDMASRVIDDLDTDGDGVLSADEISKSGKLAQRILDADTDGDGIVTKDELISKISKHRMHPPSASDIASRVIDDLDTNGDGFLSADEISKGGKLTQKILDADTDGDGIVTKDELISKITEDLENMEGFPKLLVGEQPDINQLKSLLALIGTEQSNESTRSGTDLLTQILSQFNLSDDEIETVLEMMQKSGINIIA